jgi:hypothetical protein
MVFARIPTKSGLSALFKLWGVTNAIIFYHLQEDLAPLLYILHIKGFFNHQGIQRTELFYILSL